MSEHEAPENPQHAFRLLIGVIAGILVIGMALLVTVVVVYRMSPGRNLPFVESTPSAPAHTPATG
jgi:hypothetical protein